MTNEEMTKLLKSILDASKEKEVSNEKEEDLFENLSEELTANLFDDIFAKKQKTPARKRLLGMSFAKAGVPPEALADSLYKTELTAIALNYLFEEFDITHCNVLSALLPAIVSEDIEAVTGKKIDAELTDKYVPIFIEKANELEEVLKDKYGTKTKKQKAILNLILATQEMS